MKYDDLTMDARRLQKEYDEIKFCVVCNGKGTYYQNTPVGAVEQICFLCHGTGKKTNLFL